MGFLDLRFRLSLRGFNYLIGISYCSFKEGAKEGTPIPTGFPAGLWTEEGSPNARAERGSLSLR